MRSRDLHASAVRPVTTNVSSKNPTGVKDHPSPSYSSIPLQTTHYLRRKHELLTRSIRKMERTLDTVLKSIGNPSIASGMLSRSPSPSPATATTQALIAASPPHSPASYHRHMPGSPKLHSLPDNALNPLGLLAEASLANRRTQGHASSMIARGSEANGTPMLGVASDNYFKPGRNNASALTRTLTVP